MNKLLLTHSCNVYKIVGETTTPEGLVYFCKDMEWNSERYDYVEVGQILQTHVKEPWVEVIDSNSFTIRLHLDRLMGFDEQCEIHDNEQEAELWNREQNDLDRMREYEAQQHLDY